MATEKKNLGFGGQWIDLFKVGRQTGFDDDGKKVTVDIKPDFLKSVAVNYDSTLHEAPACIGHPKNDAPAYGWVAGMRVEGDTLQAQFADTDPGFEKIVNEGRYKKRSAKFYLDEKGCGKFPYLRHVGWLGAEPPAVKGMRDVGRHAQFSEDEGETVAFEIEFSEGENMTDVEKKALQEETSKGVLAKIGEALGFGKESTPATVAFSEADRAKLIADATAAASVAFSEELKKRDEKIAELTNQVNSQVGGSKRAEIVSFCEKLEAAGRLPKTFRRMGGVEFLEALAGMPAEAKVATIEFAEVDGKEVEKKKDVSALAFAEMFLSSLPPYIQFGEQFNDLRATGDGSDIANPQQLDSMRAAVGLSTSDERKAKSA